MKGITVWARLQEEDRALLGRLAALAGPQSRVALVGGAVRDALLGQTPLDLDVVVEGADVEAVAQAAGLPYLFHPAFQNATLTLPDGRAVDLVRSRRETYPLPGQNPLPAPGTLEDDLRRRDFSLNALALVVGPEAIGTEPELLDVVGGVDDLRARLLRPLHARSFHEDASRLIRGARLAARLDLQAVPELLAQVPDALERADHTPRLWAELKLLLQEPRPYLAALKLQTWGAGQLLPDLSVLRALNSLPDVNAQTHAAAFLAGAADPAQLAAKLALGEKPLGLLERARSDAYFPPGTAELQLRGILNPASYLPLTGKDVLALGVPPGKAVGEALNYLSELRRAGHVKNQAEERAALLTFVKGG